MHAGQCKWKEAGFWRDGAGRGGQGPQRAAAGRLPCRPVGAGASSCEEAEGRALNLSGHQLQQWRDRGRQWN